MVTNAKKEKNIFKKETTNKCERNLIYLIPRWIGRQLCDETRRIRYRNQYDALILESVFHSEWRRISRTWTTLYAEKRKKPSCRCKDTFEAITARSQARIRLAASKLYSESVVILQVILTWTSFCIYLAFHNDVCHFINHYREHRKMRKKRGMKKDRMKEGRKVRTESLIIAENKLEAGLAIYFDIRVL